MFVVIVNAALGVYQENKAEKALEALQEMSSAMKKLTMCPADWSTLVGSGVFLAGIIVLARYGL